MKRITVLGLAAASFAAVSLTPVAGQEIVGAAAVTGAGSTFAHPIVSKWWQGYRAWVAGGGDFPVPNGGLDDPPAAPQLDYEPSGSLAGMMRVRAGAVDFAAADVPLKTSELQKLGLAQFPIVIGGIVAVVNIDGIGPGEMKLTGPLLADIFLGKVQNWSDPAIKALNPDLKLPDARIALVYRSDGSGTTYNFANYLSSASPEWRERVGFDLLVAWPGGTGARGNSGVSQAVRATKNSIGYVEYAHAVQTRLSFATIQNRAGRFVRPSPQSFQAAAANTDWGKASDFDLLMIDAPGEAAYPIVATVFVMMPKATAPRRMRAALDFFAWSLEKGTKDAADLGYVPLPPGLVTQVKNYWAKTFRPGT
jgi:phosphate transport system substrate-binding protein